MRIIDDFEKSQNIMDTMESDNGDNNTDNGNSKNVDARNQRAIRKFIQKAENDNSLCSSIHWTSDSSS
jgi:hypothetical protein